MHVACATNATYLPHVATMIESLGASNDRHGITVHILHDESVDIGLQARMRAVEERSTVRLEFILPDAAMRATLPPTPPGWLDLIWYRMLLPDLLAPADRVLYLDADTLVVQDLGPLWGIDFRGALLAAVRQHPKMPGASRLRALGWPIEPYLNSGVLMMDLAAMRDEALAMRISDVGRELADRYAGPTRAGPVTDTYPDQDAYNVACEGRWLAVHPRWNCFASLYVSGLGGASDDNDLDLAFAEAITSPAILHFEGSALAKPWHARCLHPHRGLYSAYRSRAGWPLEQLEGASPASRFLRRLPVPVQTALANRRRRRVS